MAHLSPQKSIIVTTLRDMKWHCGREWLNEIKDDRIRITELNRGYMKEKGYQIIGEACKGSVCGNGECPLFKRKAVKLGSNEAATPPQNVQNLPSEATKPVKTSLPTRYDIYSEKEDKMTPEEKERAAAKLKEVMATLRARWAAKEAKWGSREVKV